MTERTARVASASGLHARPASVFVAAVTKTGIPVTIAKDDGTPVNAGSILGLIALGVKHGDTVRLAAEGADADSALDGLVTLLETDLDTA
jgi:phosphocarrier protein HPr